MLCATVHAQDDCSETLSRNYPGNCWTGQMRVYFTMATERPEASPCQFVLQLILLLMLLIFRIARAINLDWVVFPIEFVNAVGKEKLCVGSS